MKLQNLIHILIGIVCLGLLPKAQAVSPAPDGGYPGGNTAEGQAALLSRTTGGFNTAVGYLSLRSDTTGSFNSGLGAGTLLANTGDENTAAGAGALLSNTTGGSNTANGAFALVNNTIGNANTATGDRALFSNTIDGGNTATGALALYSNTTGALNTATGSFALSSNTTSQDNTADGESALNSNTTGNDNTATGAFALGFNTTGSDNVALGFEAGSAATTGSNNVYIGASMAGIDGESNACYIASIFNQTSVNGIPVLINSANKLGTTTSSKRFKDDIKPMDKASDALLALKPVTFRYKKEIDPHGISQFGLVAEDVEKVNPDLVVRDKQGKPYTVRYDAVNAMLLNEFLKEYRKNERQETTIVELKSTVAQQQKQIEALTAGLQKVSAQIEVIKPAPQTVLNNH
jgi:hypothetical protein